MLKDNPTYPHGLFHFFGQGSREDLSKKLALEGDEMRNSTEDRKQKMEEARLLKKGKHMQTPMPPKGEVSKDEEESWDWKGATQSWRNKAMGLSVFHIQYQLLKTLFRLLIQFLPTQ